MLSVLMSLIVVRHTHGRLPCTKERVPRARICVSDLVHVGLATTLFKSAIALLTYRRATLTPSRKKRPREREQPGPQPRRRLREENANVQIIQNASYCSTGRLVLVAVKPIGSIETVPCCFATGILAQVTAARKNTAKMPSRTRMRASLTSGESIALDNWQVTRGRPASM
jgi:hypothetical protein